MAAGPIDRFAKIRTATDAHRAQHGCGAYPYDNGPLLGALAAAADARRILELGTALGYTALSFAAGAPDATVDTIERDPDHALLARDNIAAAAMDHRITVHEGDFASVLPTLDPGYDVAFFDGQSPTPALHKTLRGLLAYRWDTHHRQSEPSLDAGRGAQSAVRRQVLAQRAGHGGRRDRDQRQALTPCGGTVGRVIQI